MPRKSVYHFFQFFTPISKQRWLQLFIASFISRNTFCSLAPGFLFYPHWFSIIWLELFLVIWSWWWVLLKNLYHFIAFVYFWFMSSSICVVGSVSYLPFLFSLFLYCFCFVFSIFLAFFVFPSLTFFFYLFSLFLFFSLPFSSLFFLPRFQLLEVKTCSFPQKEARSRPHRPVPSGPSMHHPLSTLVLVLWWAGHGAGPGSLCCK